MCLWMLKLFCMDEDIVIWLEFTWSRVERDFMRCCKQAECAKTIYFE